MWPQPLLRSEPKSRSRSRVRRDAPRPEFASDGNFDLRVRAVRGVRGCPWLSGPCRARPPGQIGDKRFDTNWCQNRPAAWNARAPDCAIGRLRKLATIVPRFLTDPWVPEARLAFTKK